MRFSPRGYTGKRYLGEYFLDHFYVTTSAEGGLNRLYRNQRDGSFAESTWTNTDATAVPPRPSLNV
jgi:hypothetical protein